MINLFYLLSLLLLLVVIFLLHLASILNHPSLLLLLHDPQLLLPLLIKPLLLLDLKMEIAIISRRESSEIYLTCLRSSSLYVPLMVRCSTLSFCSKGLFRPNRGDIANISVSCTHITSSVLTRSHDCRYIPVYEEFETPLLRSLSPSVVALQVQQPWSGLEPAPHSVDASAADQLDNKPCHVSNK